jgi:hypothetical protein
MGRWKYGLVAALLGFATPAWAINPLENTTANSPTNSTTNPAHLTSTSGAGGQLQPQGVENPHRQKRRDAQNRLRKALEEKNALKAALNSGLARSATAQGGAK